MLFNTRLFFVLFCFFAPARPLGDEKKIQLNHWVMKKIQLNQLVAEG